MSPAAEPLPVVVPPPPGPGRRLVSLREDVEIEYTDPYRADDPLVAHTPWGRVDLGPQDGVGRAALWRMSLGPVDPANLRRDRRGGHPGLEALLARLADVTVHSLAPADGTRPLLSVTPLAPGAGFVPVDPAPDEPVELAAAAAVERTRDGFAVAAGWAPFRVDLHRPFAARLAALLATPRTPDELCVAVGAEAGLVRQIVADLHGAGVLVGSPGRTGPVHHHGSHPTVGPNGATRPRENLS